jgi:hypothetical protein
MAAELKSVGMFIGRKLPLTIVPGGEVQHGVSHRYAEGLTTDDPLVNRFLEIKDLSGFKNYCHDYGLLMLRPLIDKKAKRKSAEGLLAGMFLDPKFLDWGADGISENHVEAIWNLLKENIARIQSDVQSLEDASKDAPDLFLKRLNKVLKRSATITVAHWHNDDDSGSWSKDAPGRFSLAVYSPGIQETCYLLVAIATQQGRLQTCGRSGCNHQFIQTINKAYCSENCKRSARRQRRSDDPVEKTRRALKSRVERRRGKGLLTAEQEGVCRGELNRAQTQAALRRIERKYDLERQAPGRKRRQDVNKGG